MGWDESSNEQKTRHKAKKKPQDNDLSPEQRLWRQVILLLIQDVQYLKHRHMRSLNGKRGHWYNELQTEIRHAHSPWIAFICELAGLSHPKLKNVLSDIESGKLVVPHIGRQHKCFID